jgi:hypothetical protein
VTGAPPVSIRRSVALVCAIVALSVLNVLLTFVFIDQLVAAAIRSGQGLTEASARSSIAFNGVFGLLFAVLWLMLGRLVRRGTAWARVALTVLAVIGIVFGLMSLSLGLQRTEFVLVGVATLVLQAVLVYFLWRGDASRYLKSGPQPTR